MASAAFIHISKRFNDGTLALDDFNLSIEDGELLVLVGPSGCGKTTALRLLAGLETPDTGEISINEKTVNHATPQQRNVAMVFQNYALYPHMSVHANLAFPLRMANVPAEQQEERIRHIAQILDLTGLLARRPKQLSGGQRQRVAMGRALVRNPSVFLLDEPLSNLDAKLRAQIRADIARLQRRLHNTTLYVTHDQVEAMTLGDRVAVMDHGRLQQLGTPAELYQNPRNIFVAHFIGNPGMNIWQSQLSASNNNLQVSLFGQPLPLPRNLQQEHPVIGKHIGKDIQTGIRPEALATLPVNGSIAIRAQVTNIEFLGHESLVYFSTPDNNDRPDENPLIARLPGKYDGRTGSIETLWIKPQAMTLFEEDGKRLA